MNDDRKFKERAETIKELFLARIPTDVIAKIVGISESTVAKDRNRIAKLYGIKVPNVGNSALERPKRFRLLLKTFLEVRFETHNQENPLYKASKLTIDFERIETHIYTIISLFKKLKSPRFTSNNSVDKNYQQLIEHCISRDDYLPREVYRFLKEFYEAIHSGQISMEEINDEQGLIELSTKFYCDKNRNSVNTIVIDNPKALVNTIFSALTEIQVLVIRGCYGLECKKKDLNEIANELGLRKERIRQIREKSIRILKYRLERDNYLIHSTARYNRLEQQYTRLEEKYRIYCKETDQEILTLKIENAKLRGIFDNHDGRFDVNNYSPIIQTLIRPIRETDLPIQIKNSLHGFYDYILDAIENWDNLGKRYSFGKKRYVIFDNYLLKNGIDRHKISLEEKVIARQLIKRLR